MSERAREPLFFEDPEGEGEPEPSRESAGSGGSLTSVGSGLRDSGSDDEPPIEFGMAAGDNPGREGTTVQRRLGTAISLMSRVYSLPIADLNLSMRAANTLRRGGLLTVGQVLKKTEDELLALRNFGRKECRELRGKLDEMGILPNHQSVN